MFSNAFRDALSDEERITQGPELDAWLTQISRSQSVMHLSGPGGLHKQALLRATNHNIGICLLQTREPELDLVELQNESEVHAVVYLDNVRIQFELTGFCHPPLDGQEAVACDKPTALFRFQRREFFRVRPMPHAQAEVVLPHPSQDGVSVHMPILDISVGGCALLIPNDLPPLPLGSDLRHVEVRLDANARLRLDLRLLHITSIDVGESRAQLGCEFINRSSQDERILAHYVEAAQRWWRMMDKH